MASRPCFRGAAHFDWKGAMALGWRPCDPFARMRRLILQHGLNERLRFVPKDQHVAMSMLQKSLRRDMIKKREQPVVETRDVEQGAWLCMAAKLRPRPDFEYFLERPDPTRKRDEAVGQLRHQRLSFMHRGD